MLISFAMSAINWEHVTDLLYVPVTSSILSTTAFNASTTDFNSVMLTGVVDCEAPGTSVEVPGSGVVGVSVGPEVVGSGDEVPGSTVDGTVSHSSSMVAAPDVTYLKQYSFSGMPSLEYQC